MTADTRGFFESNLVILGARRSASSLFHAALPAEARPPRPGLTLSQYRHVADCHELAFVTKGKGRVVTPSATFDLQPGQLLVIDFGVDHEELPTSASGEYSMLWCALFGTAARLDETARLRGGTYESGPLLLLEGAVDVESIASAISGEMYRREWGWCDSVNSLLRYLSRILVRRLRRGDAVHSRRAEAVTVSAEPRAWRVIGAALRFCEANFRQPLRLAEVAAAVGYSSDYLNRLFSTHVGSSVSNHVRYLRVAAAKEMLARNEIPLHQVALSVGYSDHSHFTRAFTRVVGESPKAYRKRLAGR